MPLQATTTLSVESDDEDELSKQNQDADGLQLGLEFSDEFVL